MTLTVSPEILVPIVVLAVAFGWYIAWRKMQKVDQELREKTAERERLHREARDRDLQRLMEAARNDPDYAFFHQEAPVPSLTEEQRQRARRLSTEVTQRITGDLGSMNRAIEETMRRAFQPLDRAMGDLDRQVQRMGGQQGFTSVTVTTRTESSQTQASQAKAKQEAAQKAAPPAEPANRFDRILRDD